MQASPYASAVPATLAEMENQREADGSTPPPDPEEEPEKVVYVYPLEGGGVVFTDTPIEEDGQQPQAPVVDAQEPKTDKRPTATREPVYFLHFLLILFLFAGLDSLNALFAPTVTITIATVTIPAATPGNPPQFGQATVMAHALRAGAGGNIRAGDIAITGSALQVSNSEFQGGQDARDFTTVTQADIDRPAAMLKAQVAQSMQAALGQQLAPGEQLQKAPCAPAVAADPAIGQEASSVRVTVSETCSGFAYNSQQLTARGAKLLTAQALRLLGNGYARFGNITVSVTKAAIEGQTAVLTFTCQGTWVYRINAARIEALVSGKPRLAALQLLGRFPGIARAGIGGIADNQELPTDMTHIHVLILFPAV